MGERERDEVSSAEPAADLTRTCANCGDRLELDEWCPVVTRTDGEGNLQLYSFCDEACMVAWEEANG